MKLSVLSLVLIGFGVWLVFAGTRYREEYAQTTEAWRVGSVRTLEISLGPPDMTNLACASDHEVAGLHCAYRANLAPAGAISPNDPMLLQPYNTVNNELFLGAGLWNSLDVRSKDDLPKQRFTAVCSYEMRGVVKSVAVRFSGRDPLRPHGRTAAAGILTDCTIPR
jgi:hypothetical protein